MAKTSCRALVNFIDITAHDDANYSTTDNLEDVGNLALFDNKETYANVGTTELNDFILDGTIADVSAFEFPFWSAEVSQNDCTFENNPTILIEFDNAHTSSGLTLSFFKEYPRELKVTWYYDSSANTKILEKTFFPDALEYFCSEQIEHYKAIKIEFIRTMLPKRSIKMSFVVFGQEVVWNDERIMKASVHEDVDVTSATIPINTAEIEIEDVNNQFNIQNDKGLWKSIQTNQEVTITETVNGNDVNVGTFYIDTWESSNASVKLSLIDGIGYIDKTRFVGGFYNKVKASELVAEIMASAGYSQYTISDDIKNIELSGYLPIMTHREALQQVAFAIGATVDCSRGASINISVPDRNVDSYILTDRKFSGKTKTELDEYVSGVQITCNKYFVREETTEIYKGELPLGTTRIEFTEPYTSLSCTGGTITASGVNFADVLVNSSGEVSLTGIGYDASEFTIEKKVPLLR